MCKYEAMTPPTIFFPYKVSLSLLALIFIFAVSSVQAQTPEQTKVCTENPGFYETHSYHVAKVSIGLPFRTGSKAQKLLGLTGVQSFLNQELRDAQSDMSVDGRGLSDGALFKNVDGYLALQFALTTNLSELRPGVRITFSYITPKLLNCDDVQKTLDVFYGVVSIEPFSYLTSVFENRADRLTPTSLKGGLQTGGGHFGITPMAGYNRTRGIFGGGKASVSTDNGILNRFAVGMTASESTIDTRTALSGSHDFDSGFLSHADWNFAYDYSDVPADESKRRESTAVAQIFAASNAIGNNALTFRFGVSLENGNRQTDLLPAATPPDSVARSDYSATKAYVGASWVKDRQSFKASYGVLFGSTANQLRVDYIKQIEDIAYSARFMTADHKPLRLDLQLTGGAISRKDGLIPVAERFLGGNADQEFIQGDSWHIRSGPFIRSFAENSLSRADSFGSVGGKNFFSFNLTLAQTVWNISLMPADIVDDTDILTGLVTGLTSVRSGLMSTYQESLPGFSQLHTVMLKLVGQTNVAPGSTEAGPLLKLRENLNNLKASHDPTSEVGIAIKAIEDNLSDDNKSTEQVAIDAVENARKTPNLTLDSVRLLITDKPIPSLLSTILDGIPSLETALADAGKPDPNLDVIETSLTNIRDELLANQKIATKYYDATKVEEIVTGLHDFLPSITKLQPLFDGIKQRADLELSQLPPSSDDPAEKKRIEAAQLYVSKAEAAVLYAQQLSDTIAEADGLIAESKTDDKLANEDIANAKSLLDEVLRGFGPAVPPLAVRLASTTRDLSRELEKRGDMAESSTLADEAQIILSSHTELRSKATKLVLPVIAKKAMPTMLYAERSLGVLFRELNMAAISPFVIFDAARIGPQANSAFGGVRYGVGGGVRFSMANMDLDLGYSINPNPGSYEKRGALVFSLNIYDLFK